MEKDCRQELVNAFMEKLVFLDASDASEVLNQLTVVLKDFDVKRIGTEIIPYDDQNQRLLKRYMACLCIDGKSEKTAYQYNRTAQRLAICTGKVFTEMTAYDIRYFLASEKSRGISNSTLENYRANLSAFFQWMAVEEIIGKNPCMAIKPIKIKEEVRFPYSSVEMDMMRSACINEKERALIEFLVSSGVRVSELASMDVSDVNMERLTVHVRNGKGGKERTTYINEVAKEHLVKYLKSRPEDGPCLFYSGWHKRITADCIRYMLKQLGKRAGVETVHPHRFRRTFATGLADRGMRVQEIMQLLGHSDINTTMEYVSMSDDRVQISYKRYIA